MECRYLSIAALATRTCVYFAVYVHSSTWVTAIQCLVCPHVCGKVNATAVLLRLQSLSLSPSGHCR